MVQSFQESICSILLRAEAKGWMDWQNLHTCGYWKNNVWKMKRVLSYDHGLTPYQKRKKEINVPDKVLQRYARQIYSPSNRRIVNKK